MMMRTFFLAAFVAAVTSLCAAPQQLLKVPLESPDSSYSANVEWDTAGFIGRIRMLVDSPGKTSVVELPQIKPSPANLTWITNEWVACESFVAENGAAFFYMDVLREKAYLIEIFAPDDEKSDWLISFTTNDSVSSDTIQTLSIGHSTLFPILLRNLPDEGLSYLSPDFPFLLSDAVDTFVEWRKREQFVEMKFLTDMSISPKTGCLVIASVDDVAEIVYFPQGTTTTREMLALTRRQALPGSVQKIIKGIDPPTLDIKWTDDQGQFQVLASWEDDTTTVTELVTGRFEGVSDSPYTGPGLKELISDNGGTIEKIEDKQAGKISITDSKKKPAPKMPSKSKPKVKKPSRSN